MTAPHDPALLISGAGLPAWIWDDLREVLRRDTVVAPRPSQGAEAGLQDYAATAIESTPPGSFAIVAHSSGGVIGAEIARLAPERVSAFLAVSAVVPRPGGSFVSSMPAPNRWVLSAAMRIAGTRPPDSAMRRRLCAGLDDTIVDRIVADFTPESAGLYRDTTSLGSWNGKRGYVLTTQDRELPVAVQRRSAEHLGATWHAEHDTGHLPMLTSPQALASSIEDFFDTPPAV